MSCSGTRTKQEDAGMRETNSCDFEICLCCSETRTRQADPGQSDCLVLGPEQNNQIPEPQNIFLRFRDLLTSRLPGICFSRSGPRTGQADCPGSACPVLVPEQNQQAFNHKEQKNLGLLFWGQNRTSRLPGTCLSCSGPRTRQADCPESACLFLVSRQGDKQI